MVATVAVKPKLIRWAVDRSGLSVNVLAEKVPHLERWLSGEKQPTLRQLEDFAKRTMTPFGYLFLPEPPVETLSLPDFRTVGDKRVSRPSPNLLDTIHDARRRQQWMRDRLIEQGHDELPFVGSVNEQSSIKATAKKIRETLGLEHNWAEHCPNWEEALRRLRDAIEDIGILVSASGIVGLNTHRALDPEEFRGFVICERYAPLVFVNGVDAKSAQMFTLAHELAHVWLGQDGLFNLVQTLPAANDTEKFCNRVAAEFLVPAEKLTSIWPEAKETTSPFLTISRRFKVSPLVAARRALDLEMIAKEQFFAFYRKQQQEWEAQKAKAKQKSGGDFYRTQDVRLGRRFARAIVQAVREGQLLYHDAYQITGLKGDTFEKYATHLTQQRGG